MVCGTRIVAMLCKLAFKQGNIFRGPSTPTMGAYSEAPGKFPYRPLPKSIPLFKCHNTINKKGHVTVWKPTAISILSSPSAGLALLVAAPATLVPSLVSSCALSLPSVSAAAESPLLDFYVYRRTKQQNPLIFKFYFFFGRQRNKHASPSKAQPKCIM